jgi:geranylgeranyl reductase family protein
MIVVGAGPAGCRTAEIVAKKGYDVLILEEHDDIGKPTQCTGLVSHRIGKLPKSITVNKIKTARFCCGNSSFDVKSKKPVYVIDRERYDNFLADRARKAGARIMLSTRFLDFANGRVRTNRGEYETDLLVGADGPNSTVARKAGIELPENILLATQVRAKSEFDPDVVELWFGITPDNFAWVVPENENTARVGVMTSQNPNRYLEKFIRMKLGEAKTSDRIGDMIRYGLIEKSVCGNTLLVGDAASMIKPFSGGGLIYGQIGAEFAGRACLKALESNNFSEKFLLDNYDEKWKQELEKPIKHGLLVKKIFQKFNKTFYFDLIKKAGVSKIASSADIDFLH